MIMQDKDKVYEYSKPWHIEENADLLPMMFTGRSTRMRNKLGEELTDEEMQKLRMEIMERMHHVDRAKMEERMKRMQEFAKNMPLELISVMRVQVMVSLRQESDM